MNKKTTFWSVEELSLLNDLFVNKKLEINELCKRFRQFFKNRTKSAIKGVIHRKLFDDDEKNKFKKINSKTNRTVWTQSEVEMLIKLYEIDGLSSSEIYPIFNKHFNRTIISINNKITKLNLHHSKEQLTNIKSRLNKGEKNAMFGKISSKKGLTKEKCESIKKGAEKLSRTLIEKSKNGELRNVSGDKNPMYGTRSWSNGLNKYSSQIIFDYGRKISINKKLWWQLQNNETKQVILNRLNLGRIKCQKNTKIERKIENYLQNNNIKYIKQFKIKEFYADFYIPNKNIVIECDGDYWHANPIFYNDTNLTKVQLKNIERDNRKKITFSNNGINSIFLWETDIIYFFDKVKGSLDILLL